MLVAVGSLTLRRNGGLRGQVGKLTHALNKQFPYIVVPLASGIADSSARRNQGVAGEFSQVRYMLRVSRCFDVIVVPCGSMPVGVSGGDEGHPVCHCQEETALELETVVEG